MKTDDLIEQLAADLPPVRPGTVGRRIAATAVAGGCLALVLVLAGLGLRPDLSQAAGGMMFWMKAGYALALAGAGFWCAERLSRPAASARGGLIVVVAAVAVVAVIAAGRLMVAPADERMALWMGHSWRICPTYILALSLPTLALALVVMRRFAPTRLRLSGAAAGLFAGGVGAAVYGLHCTETGPPFLATWYSLGVALSAATGALVGPGALRWR